MPALQPADFSCNQVLLERKVGESESDEYGRERHRWQRGNWSCRPSAFCASPRLQRLFSHVHHLAFTTWEEPLSGSMLCALTPASPTAASAFARLRVLQLAMWNDDVQLLQRLFPSSAAFPSLTFLNFDVDSNAGTNSPLDRRALLPLGRLPRLRCLKPAKCLSVDGFLFSTWQDVEFPSRGLTDVCGLGFGRLR